MSAVVPSLADSGHIAAPVPARGAWGAPEGAMQHHGTQPARPQNGRAPQPKMAARKAPAALTPSTTPAVVPPPPRTWAERAAEAAGDRGGEVQPPSRDATTSRVNPTAAKLAAGKKLSRGDLAGYTDRERDMLKLHRSLQYRQSEAYQQKQHDAEALQRQKTLERWHAGGELAKPSRSVHVADHLARLLAAAPALPPPKFLGRTVARRQPKPPTATIGRAADAETSK
jgi:hypothetical protein